MEISCGLFAETVSAARSFPKMRKALSRLGLMVYQVRRSFRDFEAVRSARRFRRERLCEGEPVRVAYLHPEFPYAPHEAPPAGGGGIKYLWMEQRFPHSFPECHVVYVVSSSMHSRILDLLDAAKRSGIPIVWNQNGAYFPHSYGPDRAARGNEIMSEALRKADYVFYQSEFAKRSSDALLGPVKSPHEILYNAVDVSRYNTPPRSWDGPITILAAGSHDDGYRIPLVLNAFERARHVRPGLRLIIAGRVSEADRALICRQSQDWPAGTLEFWGTYQTKDAPAVFARAHIFLHAKATDVCPSVVIEAMAAGLPIVYSATGGTPELVGDAGVGVPGNTNWAIHEPPSPEELSEALLSAIERGPVLSVRARERAKQQFDLATWLDRHEAIFRQLAGGEK